jgi:hypothetical protein
VVARCLLTQRGVLGAGGDQASGRRRTCGQERASAATLVHAVAPRYAVVRADDEIAGFL